jgi:hypothetical protein
MSCSPKNMKITDSDLANPRFPDLRPGPIRRGPVSRFPFPRAVSNGKRETRPQDLQDFRRTGLVGTWGVRGD